MIDSHAHLDDEKIAGDLQETVANFAPDGIDAVINNSCDKQSMQRGFDIAQKHERVFCTVGMHPHTAKDFGDDFKSTMRRLASNEKVVAVGEIGLDYYYDLSERSVQRDVFAEQIEIADSLGLPITLHVRDAYGDALDVLTAQKRFLNNGVLWHCYSGSAEFARQMAKKGHYFAFGGAITFKNADKAEVIRAVPQERLLVETDSPYMTPVPFRGKPNHPKYVRLVLEKLAETLQISFQEAEKLTTQNCLTLFPKLKEFYAKHQL